MRNLVERNVVVVGHVCDGLDESGLRVFSNIEGLLESSANFHRIVRTIALDEECTLSSVVELVLEVFCLKSMELD